LNGIGKLEITYEIGSREAENVLALGHFYELIGKVVGGIAVFAGGRQLDVEAAHRVVTHLQRKAVFLRVLFYQLCRKLAISRHLSV